MANCLVRYLRDGNRVPFGCMVATSPENFGVSFCRSTDFFRKKTGRNIACGRAVRKSSFSIPNRLVQTEVGVVSMSEFLANEIQAFSRRMKKYFSKELRDDGVAVQS